MMNTPSRSGTPPQLPLPIFGKSLQISPNLEALLQHDELTRRGSGSPTTPYEPTMSQMSGIASLAPPPPPRHMQGIRKTGVQEVRAKDVQRKKSINTKPDSWPDALPVLPSERTIGVPPSSTSRSATSSNPYINPTPVVRPGGTSTAWLPHVDDSPTLRAMANPSTDELVVESSLPGAESGSHPSTTDPQYHAPASSRSSPAMHRVEKILNRGRESLNLFTGSAISGVSKHRPDAEGGQRSSRAEYVNFSVNNSAELGSPVPQERAAVSRKPSHQSSVRGDKHAAVTASVTAGSQPSQQSSSRLAERHPDNPLLVPRSIHSEASSTRSLSVYSQSSYSYADGDSIRAYRRASQPDLSLAPMSSCPRLKPVERVTGDDQSFIDLFSQSNSDDTILNDEESLNEVSPFHLRTGPSITIPSPSVYSTRSHNVSSTSLATMTFAPPSPGGLSSPMDAPPESPSALSSMVFAPPSPTMESLAEGFPQPSSPCSSSSSLTSIEFAPPRSPLRDDPDKPSLPSVHRLTFERGRRLRVSSKRSVSASPRPTHYPFTSPPLLPPTTNVLDANERADLIRRNRKLTQLLGQTPPARGLPPSMEETRSFRRLPPPALTALLGSNKQRNHRHAVSVSVSVKGPGNKTEPSSPWQIDDPWSPGGRRHSIPLTPSSFTFYLDDDPNGASTNDHRGLHSLTDPQNPRESPTSFIDLSDEEVPHGDDVSAISSIDVRMANRRRFFYHSSSTPSLVESLNTEGQAEEERRRKRDKLAKLHRFLGSRLPPDLVINSATDSSLEPTMMPDESPRENWLRGRRAGSVKPVEHFDRGKEELDEMEKAINVRRAQKMERVFGTPPPQTLFHTRQGRSTLVHSQPSSPTIPCTTTPFVFSVDPPSNTRNFNQSAYKGKRTHRPGTSESSQRLLPSKTGSSSSSPYRLSEYQDVLAQSTVYMNYQHSLNSLIDIIDRDDRESLVELHRVLHSDVVESPAEDQPPVDRRRISVTSSLKSERRHSLPVRASLTSMSSDMSLLSARPEVSEFQLRRRRAAKLTHFFGVDYRELIHDILESIEKGVEEERRHGTLQPEEVEVLLHRVRSLRTKQDQLF